ncbi:MAG TPA: NADH-quinone oxidoreductase subunit H, partial [Rhizomicrobium sp.]|nr:NADH-quinone oxidoreductase subunit H [Rhizomicrobium sp.]
MLFTNLFAHWGMGHSLGWAASQFLTILLFDVMLLVSVAFLLLADRIIWAAVQMRRGPNVVGPFGLLQTFADLFKFLFKEV